MVLVIEALHVSENKIPILIPEGLYYVEIMCP
jgi:hypothetical protein